MGISPHAAVISLWPKNNAFLIPPPQTPDAGPPARHLYFSASFYKILPAFWTVDADLPVSSWDPDFLAAAGAFEDFIAAAFAKAEADLFPIFIYMEGKV